jgi:ADP-ribose pyrophosphatase YjhB (NUDIX family)/ribosomal protein S27AE
MTSRHRHAKKGAVDYQFCPKCGGPLGLLHLKKGEPPRLVCADCHFVFYLDPKVASATVVPYRGGIVMVKRSVEPGFGLWVIPGGFVDRGETPEEAAVRETWEEASLEVRIVGLIGMYSYVGPSVVVLSYLAEHVGGRLKASDESSDARAFPYPKIPWRRIAFESTARTLRDWKTASTGRRAWVRPRPGFTPGPLVSGRASLLAF